MVVVVVVVVVVALVASASADSAKAKVHPQGAVAFVVGAIAVTVTDCGDGGVDMQALQHPSLCAIVS